MMNSRFARALFTLSCLALPMGAQAQGIELPFEGFLTGADDMPASGTMDVIVRLYDAPTGGTPLFEETHTNLATVGG